MTDNLRYVGDVFIDGKTDILLREFLTNLFEQYNGEGKGFDADMLDGHHYSEIEYALQLLEDTKLSEIKIGESVFNADNSGAYLHFSDVVYDDDPLQWMINHNFVNYNITNALSDLYQYLINYVDEIGDTKVDKEKVDPNDNSDNPRMKVLSDNNFSDQCKSNLTDLSGLLDDFVDYTDINGVTHHFLSADLTNGLRFILITQADYDNLASEHKNYWRNVFIIKESIPTTIDYHSPLEFDLKDGYDFRVAQDDAPITDYIVQDDGSGRDFWLQLKHKWDNNWTNLMPLQDFLLGVDIKGEIIDILENNTDVAYNPTAIKKAILPLLTNSSNANYISLPYLPSTYKDKFVHRIYKGSTALPTAGSDGFTNVDIGNAFDTEFTNINNKINGITNANKTGSLDIQIAELNSVFNDLNTEINGNQETSILKRLASIDASLGSIQDDITAIKEVTTNVKTWESYEIPNLIGDSNNGKTINYYNTTLGLAVISFGFSSYYRRIPKDEWHTPAKNNSGTVFPYTVVKAKPVTTLIIPNQTHTDKIWLSVDRLGRIRTRINYQYTGTSTSYHSGSIFYRFNKLYTDEELTKIHTLNLKPQNDSTNIDNIDNFNILGI